MTCSYIYINISSALPTVPQGAEEWRLGNPLNEEEPAVWKGSTLPAAPWPPLPKRRDKVKAALRLQTCRPVELLQYTESSTWRQRRPHQPSAGKAGPPAPKRVWVHTGREPVWRSSGPVPPQEHTGPSSLLSRTAVASVHITARFLDNVFVVLSSYSSQQAGGRR